METIDRVKTFSRSFRVSWGPDGRLVRPLADGRIEIHKVSFGLIRPTTEEEQKEEEKIHSCYVSLLKESNTVTKEKDGWDFVDKAIQKLSPAGTGTLTDQWMKRLQSVWKLIKILFAAAKQSHDLELHARYSALGSWLADYVSEKVHEEVNSGTDFQGVFCLLTGRRISEAAMKALESDDVASLRLATVIAQAASHDTRARDDVANWLKLKPELKDPDLRKIYSLLAGDFNSVREDLDWPRHLGLFLWYRKPSNFSVGDVLEEFQKFRKGSQGSPVAPVLLPTPSQDESKHDDVFYRLLKLYTKFEKMRRVDGGALPSRSTSTLLQIVDPSGYSDEKSTLDYHLAWHLFVVLRKLLAPRGEAVAATCTDFLKLTANYAFQLELAGHWEWAIYIFLLLQADSPNDSRIGEERLRSIREKAIEELLLRHIHDPQGPKKLEDALSTRGSEFLHSGTFLEFRRLVSRVISWVVRDSSIPYDLVRRYELIHHHQFGTLADSTHPALDEPYQRVALEYRNALVGGDLAYAFKVLTDVAPSCILNNEQDFLLQLFLSNDHLLPIPGNELSLAQGGLRARASASAPFLPPREADKLLEKVFGSTGALQQGQRRCSRFLIACLKYALLESQQQPLQQVMALRLQDDISAAFKEVTTERQRICLIEMAKRLVTRLHEKDEKDSFPLAEMAIDLPLPPDYRYKIIDRQLQKLRKVR